MKSVEREPMEQIDYGIGYRGYQSPQQHLNLKVDGGGIAIALSLIALGAVLAAVILLPSLIEASAEKAAAPANAAAAYANRDARVALDKIGYVQIELERKGIHISVDGH